MVRLLRAHHERKMIVMVLRVRVGMLSVLEDVCDECEELKAVRGEREPYKGE